MPAAPPILPLLPTTAPLWVTVLAIAAGLIAYARAHPTRGSHWRPLVRRPAPPDDPLPAVRGELERRCEQRETAAEVASLRRTGYRKAE